MAAQQQSLHDLFTIESGLLATRSAEAYRAIDKKRGASVTLWMLRHPIARNSAAFERFTNRLSAIMDFTPPLCEIAQCGIDRDGVAFAVLAPLDGHDVFAGNIEVHEAERRFTSVVRLVERLHGADVVCGDLCAGSFWVDRGGDVRFVGVMGSFDAEAAATAMMPPVETVAFLAPEQRGAGGLEPASDVFALGVIGYVLFTGRLPFGEGTVVLAGDYNLSRVPSIFALNPSAPIWADEVVRRCLDPDPVARYANASAVAQGIIEVRERKSQAQQVPVQMYKETTGKKNADRNPTLPAEAESIHTSMPQPLAPPEPTPIPQVRRKPGWVLPVAIGAVVVLGGVLLSARRKAPEVGAVLRDELAAHRSVVGNEQLREAIEVISETDSELSDRAMQLEKIVASDDPVAHDVLVKSAKEAKSQQFRALSEKALIDRARRLTLMRSAEQVRQWLRTLRAGETPSIYEAVLQSLDTALPAEARNALLRQIYASNGRLALRLAAALALDSNSFVDYQSVLAQLVGDAINTEEAADHSGLGLILAQPELALLFGDDVIQRREQLPDKDILWLLRVLAERNDVNVRAIANLGLERKIVSPLQAIYLQIVRDRSDLAPELLTALIRSATGTVRINDIAEFGRWYDGESERVLLGLCALPHDPALTVEVFDTLAGKSLTIEPSASLVDWVRKYAWENRAQFAPVVGMLAFLSETDPNEVRRILDSVDRYARDSAFVEILLASKSPEVARLVVERYPDTLGLGGLLNLLSNPDREVKIKAVKALKDYNDLGALKFILDNYDREKDPEVRKAYQEEFWVVKEREQRARGGGK